MFSRYSQLIAHRTFASAAGAGKSVGWKLLWTLIVLLLPVIGMILYFLIGKNT